MATQNPIPADVGADLEEAVASLWAALDGVMVVAMDLVDLIDIAQAKGRLVDVPHLREYTAKTLRKAIAQRDAALAPLGIDADESEG